jgi:hypothetical protein
MRFSKTLSDPGWLVMNCWVAIREHELDMSINSSFSLLLMSLEYVFHGFYCSLWPILLVASIDASRH